jgi:HPt (histidine-containing phosphotransfer) domain-containing protein
MSRVAGCNAHLSKPISKHKLLSLIEEYGRHRRQLDMSKTAPLQPILIEMPPELEQIVPGYLETRKAEVPQLIDLLAGFEFKRLACLGHNLKGSGGAYGFPELTRIGAALEHSAKQADAGTLCTLLTELKDYLGRVQLFAKV